MTYNYYEEQNKMLQQELDKARSSIISISITELRKAEFNANYVADILADKISDCIEAAEAFGNRFSPETIQCMEVLADKLRKMV